MAGKVTKPHFQNNRKVLEDICKYNEVWITCNGGMAETQTILFLDNVTCNP